MLFDVRQAFLHGTINEQGTRRKVDGPTQEFNVLDKRLPCRQAVGLAALHRRLQKKCLIKFSTLGAGNALPWTERGLNSTGDEKLLQGMSTVRKIN